MISKLEWRQIITAIAHTGVWVINDGPYVPLNGVISILATFAELGCAARIEPDGRIMIATKEGGDASPKAPSV